MNPRKTNRQRNVLERLENQLKSGKKTEKKTNAQVDLTDSDVKRIKKEIETLKKRVA